MLKVLRILVFLLLLVAIGFFYGITYKQNIIPYMSLFSDGNIFNALNSKLLTNQGDGVIYVLSTKTTIASSKALSKHNSSNQENTFAETNNTFTNTVGSIASTPLIPLHILGGGNSIIFLETTDRMQPPSLVLCAIESAARVYKDRPVVYFMKGLNDTNSEATAKKYFPTLSSFNNVYFFPLRMEDIFRDTPLLPWYKKVNPKQEANWIHVSSDGCRLALLWKHGGMYMDTDIISIRRVPYKNFLAAQSSQYSSNGIFGFSSHHNFTRKSMKDFTQNYNSQIWGNQGPQLFTRILKQFCVIPRFNGTEDITCGNISFLNPQRFYPIPYPAWRRYYQVWEKLPTFNDSYALHLWNYMNQGRVNMVLGSNTLVEHLYKQHCPSTYAELTKNQTANV